MASNKWSVDRDDEAMIAQIDGLAHSIISAAYAKPGPSPARQALLALLVRVSNSWKSLCLLLGCCKSKEHFEVIANDCGAILRCMFDAYFQAAFIVHDSSITDQQARLYLDFQHVERHRLAQAIVAQDNPISRMLRDSPLRKQGEARNQDEYDRVKTRFPGRSKDGVRNHWYSGGLYELAKLTGKQELYDWFVSPYHGCVHSGPLAVYSGPALPGAKSIWIALYAWAGTARLLVDQAAISLNEEQRELLDACDKDLFQAERSTGQGTSGTSGNSEER